MERSPDIGISPNMIRMLKISDIQSGDRLFYELGYKKSLDGGYGNNWVRTGRFREVLNIPDMLENDKLLSNNEYLIHHNFMILKNGIHP